MPIRFIMDDVACTGFEQSLLDCSHERIHNCVTGEAAGVKCPRPKG